MPHLLYIPEFHGLKRLLLDCMFKPGEGAIISTILPLAEGINPRWLSSSCFIRISCEKMWRVQGTWSTHSPGRDLGWQLSLPNQGLWIPAGYLPACIFFFFSIASAQKILSNFSAVQQYVSELTNHCIILFKSLISYNHASKLWFRGKKALPPLN